MVCVCFLWYPNHYQSHQHWVLFWQDGSAKWPQFARQEYPVPKKSLPKSMTMMLKSKLIIPLLLFYVFELPTTRIISKKLLVPLKQNDSLPIDFQNSESSSYLVRLRAKSFTTSLKADFCQDIRGGFKN